MTTTFQAYASSQERMIATRLVSDILAAGHVISVNDGEGFAIKRSADKAAILAALASTDSDTLVIRDASGERVGFVLLIWGNGTDLISDCSGVAALALCKGAESVAEMLASR